MKILVIDVDRDLYNELQKEQYAQIHGPDIQYEFARDTNMSSFDNPMAYVHKMETEGPEWIKPDPEVMAAIVDADIVVVHWCGVSSAMIEAAKKLKAIVAIRSGCEHINTACASAHGVHVCVAPSRLADPVADMTVALMLCVARNIVKEDLRHNNGEWHSGTIMDTTTRALCNLAVGLIGYGGIAKAVAKRLVKGFGSRVLVCESYFPLTQKDVDEDGVKLVDMDTLLAQSDIVSLHTRLSDENRGGFGREQFAKMKRTAILINTARGGLVDQDALIEALKNKVIRGAGLDVFDKEPLDPNSELLKFDNVVCTPHSAGATTDMLVNSVRLTAPELARLIRGEEPVFAVV